MNIELGGAWSFESQQYITGSDSFTDFEKVFDGLILDKEYLINKRNSLIDLFKKEFKKQFLSEKDLKDTKKVREFYNYCKDLLESDGFDIDTFKQKIFDVSFGGEMVIKGYNHAKLDSISESFTNDVIRHEFDKYNDFLGSLLGVSVDQNREKTDLMSVLNNIFSNDYFFEKKVELKDLQGLKKIGFFDFDKNKFDNIVDNISIQEQLDGFKNDYKKYLLILTILYNRLLDIDYVGFDNKKTKKNVLKIREIVANTLNYQKEMVLYINPKLDKKQLEIFEKLGKQSEEKQKKAAQLEKEKLGEGEEENLDTTPEQKETLDISKGQISPTFLKDNKVDIKRMEKVLEKYYELRDYLTQKPYDKKTQFLGDMDPNKTFLENFMQKDKPVSPDDLYDNFSQNIQRTRPNKNDFDSEEQYLKAETYYQLKQFKIYSELSELFDSKLSVEKLLNKVRMSFLPTKNGFVNDIINNVGLDLFENYKKWYLDFECLVEDSQDFIKRTESGQYYIRKDRVEKYNEYLKEKKK